MLTVSPNSIKKFEGISKEIPTEWVNFLQGYRSWLENAGLEGAEKTRNEYQYSYNFRTQWEDCIYVSRGLMRILKDVLQSISIDQTQLLESFLKNCPEGYLVYGNIMDEGHNNVYDQDLAYLEDSPSEGVFFLDGIHKYRAFFLEKGVLKAVTESSFVKACRKFMLKTCVFHETMSFEDVYINGLEETMRKSFLDRFNYSRVSPYVDSVEISTGKLVRVLLFGGIKKTEEYEDLISLIASKVSDSLKRIQSRYNGKLKVHIADNAADVYFDNDPNMGSCMKFKPEETFKIYTDNINFKAAYVCDEESGRVVGRALLHEKVYALKSKDRAMLREFGLDPRHIKLMDRIYFKDEDVRQALMNYAEKNGYIATIDCKEGKYVAYDKETGTTKGIFNLHSIAVRVKPFEDGDYYSLPWIDTFKYYLPGAVALCNRQYDSEAVLIQQTEGCIYGLTRPGEYFTCIYCGKHMHEELEPDIYFDEDGDTYCPDCFEEHMTVCECCDKVVPKNSVTEFESYFNGEKVYQVYCEDCTAQHLFVCSECGKYYRIDSLYTDNYGNICICDNCLDQSGKYMLCENCGLIYSVEESTDGKTCDECVEEIKKIKLRQFLSVINYNGREIEK